MLRITKLTDYGVVLMTHVAGSIDRQPWNARDLAAEASLPLPTVSKILKSLVRGGILDSHRGVKGGYSLTRDPSEISVAEIIGALEGPIAITECVASAPGSCDQEALCSIRANWQLINRAVYGALEKITLAEMVRPAPDFGAWLEGRFGGITERTEQVDARQKGPEKDFPELATPPPADRKRS